MNKRLLTGLLFLGGVLVSHAQVGIGTLQPNESSQLEIVASNKGILIPRVPLTSITDATTITKGNVESLLVFNTTNSADIKPGYYYWYDNRWARLVNQNDIQDLDTNTKNESFTVNNGSLILKDSDGNTVSIPLTDVNIITTLVNNNNGTYTYTSEDGTVTVINVVADVINNFQQIVDNSTVNNILKQIIKNNAGNVSYDGTSFTYIDNSGATQTINVKNIVQANQKVDTFVGNNPITVTSAATPNATGGKDYTIAVATANGTNLGVVKQAANNPSVTINQSGELFVNFDSQNNIKEVSTNYNVVASDAILLGTPTNQDITLVLPDPTLNKGKKFTVKKYDANEDYYVNVSGAIHGVTSGLYTALPYSGWAFVSDGTIWKIIEKF